MRLYLKYFSMHLKSVAQYKVSFFLTTIGQFLVSFNVFLGIYFMFLRFPKLEGFTFEEVLLCYGITLLEFSIAEMVARGFDTFPSMIKESEFDRILVRPRNEILQVLGSKVEFTRIGRMIQALVMFGYGVWKIGLVWNSSKVLVVILMLLGGTVVFSGIFLIYAAFCFFTIEGLEFMNVFIDGAREYGKYPVGVYGKRLLLFCTFIIPYALIQYYPLLYLLDRGPFWYGLLPLAACIFILPCYGFWRYGVSKYQSAGS